MPGSMGRSQVSGARSQETEEGGSEGDTESTEIKAEGTEKAK